MESPWVTGSVPSGYWKERSNRIKFFRWLSHILNYRFDVVEDWYTISKADFQKNRGGGLFVTAYKNAAELIVQNYGGGILGFFGRSPIKLLKDAFPDQDWTPWLFKNAPSNTWTDIDTRKEYMNWLGNIFNIKKNDDWYKITWSDFDNNYGSGLISGTYKGSCYRALMDCYPEYNWLPWLFTRTPKNTWENFDIQKKYMNWLADKLKFSSPQDWLKLTIKDFKNNYGDGIIRIYNSYIKLLLSIFPEYAEHWTPANLSTHYSMSSIAWIERVSQNEKIIIQHALNTGEYKIPGTRYYADGYCVETNTIYEFHGDYWHGNPDVFEQDEINKTTNCTFRELYEKTMKKESELKKLGYNVVSMWEREWEQIISI
jgi:hypothetical protein